ncbi:MAG: class I SAM-dependent methyltransferase [Ktedonobacteraceae bacterium]|nr:class I SAM-dependent methyltransferase [Ktedonobacteraceae bacterium]
MSDTPWYRAFFGEDYLRIYTPFLPAEKAEREVADMLALLDLPSGSAILDLCCGTGRHALPLAERGYAVTGQDLNNEFLQQIRQKAEEQGLSIRLVHSDMRIIPFEQEFDAIINIFTSFGYLENEEEDQQVLLQVQKALRPGGLFLLETVYQPRVLRSFSPYGIIHYSDGLIVLEERQIDLPRSRNDVRITMIYPDGRRKEYHQSIRIYTLTELARMLAAANLQLHAYYGNLDGSALTLDSRLVVLARKP